MMQTGMVKQTLNTYRGRIEGTVTQERIKSHTFYCIKLTMLTDIIMYLHALITRLVPGNATLPHTRNFIHARSDYLLTFSFGGHISLPSSFALPWIQ